MADGTSVEVKVDVKVPFTSRLINVVQGKTTGWLLAFFTIGNVAFFMHRLDATYISFMVTFMGIVLGHSIKEDYFSKS